MPDAFGNLQNDGRATRVCFRVARYGGSQRWRAGTTSLDDRARGTSDADTRRTDQAGAYEKVCPDLAAASPVCRPGYRDWRHYPAYGDGWPIAVFARPKIQNELGLSDAGRS